MMQLKEHNVLFFTRTMMLGGTENVILQLCEIFKPLVNNIVVCSCGGVNVEKLNNMGIKHYLIPDIENKSLPTIITVCKELKKIITKENITLIHTHHRMAAFYVSLLGLYKDRKFLNTSHNTFDNKKILTRFSYKHAIRIACGEMVRKNLQEIFGLDDIHVVHNSVPPFNGTVVDDPLISQLKNQGCYIVGNIGRLSEQKGMEYYIRAIPSVLKKHPNTRFLVIGSGEDEDKIKNTIKYLGIESQAILMGYRSDIQNIMAQLDLVVLSSLWEGFPLTPIEAFSVGKTIVATGVDGTTEIVHNGENGLIIAPKSSEQISDNIIWMIEHPAEKRTMENNAFISYQNEFSMDAFAKSYISCYEL